MKYLILGLFFSFAILAEASQGVEPINYVLHRVPSVGTLLIDASVDAFLRQSPPIARELLKLEKTNPTNAAVVRDFSKMLTIGVKNYQNVSVDLSGRPYDCSDVYSQAVKLGFKAVGITGLRWMGLEGGLFLVNTGGDVVSQAFLEAGKDWRKNNATSSFEDYMSTAYLGALKNGAISIPIKSAMGYSIGALIKKLQVTEGAEWMVLTAMRRPRSNVVVGLTVSFAQAILKSLFLTTGCKVAVDATRSLREQYVEQVLWQMINPTVLVASLVGLLSYVYSRTRHKSSNQ